MHTPLDNLIVCILYGFVPHVHGLRQLLCRALCRLHSMGQCCDKMIQIRFVPLELPKRLGTALLSKSDLRKSARKGGTHQYLGLVPSSEAGVRVEEEEGSGMREGGDTDATESPLKKSS